MTRLDCPHESDVLMMVTTGRWPDRAPADLRAHAAECPLCSDVALIAHAIDEDAGWARGRSSNDQEASMPAPTPLPSAGTVWWRAQLRARQDAAKAVGRPITVAQGALLAVAAGVAGAVFGATTGWFQGVLHRGWGMVSSTASSVASAVHLPSLPSVSSVFPVSSDPSVVSDYRVSLTIVVVGAALAMAVVAWALREDRT